MLAVKNIKLIHKIHLNLDELTLSLLFFMGSDSKFKINLFFEHFLRLWDNTPVFLSLVFFSRIFVYVLLERQYMAKFSLIFYRFLVFVTCLRLSLSVTESLCCSIVYYNA